MCTYSMVYDYYGKQFPQKWTWPDHPDILISLPVMSPDDLRKMIDDFHKAAEAAKIVVCEEDPND